MSELVKLRHQKLSIFSNRSMASASFSQSPDSESNSIRIDYPKLQDHVEVIPLSGKKTLVRLERKLSRDNSVFNSISSRKKKPSNPIKMNAWVLTSWIFTCCLPTWFVRRVLKKPNPIVEQAFREKVTLCMIIFLLMCIVGFMTFGLQNITCPKSDSEIARETYDTLKPYSTQSNLAIHGQVYTLGSNQHPMYFGANIQSVLAQSNGADLSALFPPEKGTRGCGGYDSNNYPLFPCVAKIPETGASVWPNSSIIAQITNRSVVNSQLGCHPPNLRLESFLKLQKIVVTNYEYVANMTSEQYGNKYRMIIIGNYVLDTSSFWDPNSNSSNVFGSVVTEIVKKHNGKDATHAFATAGLLDEAQCLTAYLTISLVDSIKGSCFASTVLAWVTLFVILIVVLARFVLALYFIYAIGWRLGDNGSYKRAIADMKKRQQEFKNSKHLVNPRLKVGHVHDIDGDITPWIPSNSDNSSDGSGSLPIFKKPEAISTIKSKIHSKPRLVANVKEAERDQFDAARNWKANFGFMDLEEPALDAQTAEILSDPSLMHCLALVTCYSEGVDSLRATLDSISHSYYPSTHKVLFVIADGIVKGSENDKTTPDILIDMIQVDERFAKDDPNLGGSPQAYSYVAIADGANRKNYAKVYAGYYKHATEIVPPVNKKRRQSRFQFTRTESSTSLSSARPSQDGTSSENDIESPANVKTLHARSNGRVPMLIIVKCGNENERNPAKPAAKPGNRGKRDSQVLLMNFLSKVMFDDRMTELEFDIFFKLFTITGVNPEKYESCLMVDADTRIYPDAVNHLIACLVKDDRVMGVCGETKISNKWDSWVFEYFVSHHLTKSFESVFGGVTCLPGCFSMYRIKTPKGLNGQWVPILANPDIVEEYSENIVDTLHKKNLLLLGEDRFLSTIMLRTFPKRRMMFVPPAICKTVVPDTFKVLLSQRRRWINSTIHNLMELLLVKDLCGTFCVSMQFVIFMELVGTVVLPAAISFTLTIIFLSFTSSADTSLSLYLLALILGLPGLLIIMTGHKAVYLFWMLIYLLSLPVWNFVLPLYAFWHFDDFSWGATRLVAGETKFHDHSERQGEFDGSGISMKRWREWVQVLREQHIENDRIRDPALYEMKRQSGAYGYENWNSYWRGNVPQMPAPYNSGSTGSGTDADS